MTARIQGDEGGRVLDEKSFSVIENIPPNVRIIRPEVNSIINSRKQAASIFAIDESGVESVEARFNEEQWQDVEQSEFEGATRSLSISRLNDGRHTLYVRASDVLGNTSNSTSHSFVVDNTNPSITVNNIQQGQIFDVSITPLVNIVDTNLDSWEATLNGKVWTQGEEVTQTGSYTMIVSAYDLAGNFERFELNFIIDSPNQTIDVSANDDDMRLRRGAWGTIKVLQNDTYENLDALRVSIVQQPAHGSIVEASKGVFNYYPNLSFVGSDEFKYRLTDTQSGESDEAIVRVSVAPSASCSIVPSHSTATGDQIRLDGWALSEGDNSESPKYKITILDTSDDGAFVVGGKPQITFPDCSLVYIPKENTSKVVTVRYQVKDVATGGDRYTSPIYTFEISIDNRDGNQPIIIPIIKLLLLDEEDEDK